MPDPSERQMANVVKDKDLDFDKVVDNYIDLVNAGRKSVAMYKRLDIKMTLDPKGPAKYALVCILTTSKWMTGVEIDLELRQFGFTRSPGSIRRGLARLVTFGLAEVEKTNDRYGRKRWLLTKAGADFALNPPLKKTARAKGSGGTKKGSKGSPVRTANMCIDPNRVTFNACVEATVGEMVTAKQAFSAYDVTRLIRERVLANPDLVTDTGQPECRVNGKMVPNILHEDVKNVVHDLFHRGLIKDYDRVRQGDYWLYIETPPEPVTVNQPIDPITAITPIGANDGGSYDGEPTLG